MAKDFNSMEDSNRSTNRSIHEVSDPARRVVLRGAAISAFLAPLGGAGMASALLGGCASTQTPAVDSAAASALPHGATGPTGPLLGFKGIAASSEDTIRVPDDYEVQVIARWGDPVGLPGLTPPFKPDAGNSAADQEAQFGMHHDGLHYYPLQGSTSGLLVMNHEYVDDGLLHTDGLENWSAEKVRKSQAAHGVSVCEVAWRNGRWSVVSPSPWARRITARTAMRISGPAAGHPMMRTAADPTGTRVLGTFNNCASGKTPWGTYLTSEENFVGYFSGPAELTPHQQRWGMRKAGSNSWYRWHLHDERFDAARHPNEHNRFGWIVEIDPLNPSHTPVKRTALGRAAHEGATVAMTRNGRAVVYMGEDARFEYIYKFVSRDVVKPGGLAANSDLLDHGILYVARFDSEGRGRWLPLVHGQGGLTADQGFADQGEVLVKSRQASDALGGTKMDRPEWIAVDRQGWVYCTLTNNSARGTAGQPAVDAANPRANNAMGHIIRWKEDGDHDSLTFRWSHFVLAGDPRNEREQAKGNVKGDSFACPDGLWVDGRGVLWIQTDMSTSSMGKGEWSAMGNNAMLAADPLTGEIRRFLVGPVGCEITGATATPDGRTMFINIQHPGESPSERSNPANPGRYSTWPDKMPGSRPRSATVVIRRRDGGPIGSS